MGLFTLFIGLPFVINPKELTSLSFEDLFNCTGVATIKLRMSSSFIFPPEDEELDVICLP